MRNNTQSQDNPAMTSIPVFTNQADEKYVYRPWCGRVTTIIQVHGHGQCARFGTNIDECCRGEMEQEDHDI